MHLVGTLLKYMILLTHCVQNSSQDETQFYTLEAVRLFRYLSLPTVDCWHPAQMINKILRLWDDFTDSTPAYYQRCRRRVE